MTNQRDLADKLLEIRDQAAKAEAEIKRKLSETRVLFDVSWALAPNFTMRLE